MEGLQTVLLVIQLVLAFFMVVVILTQRTSQDGSGLTGSSGSTMGGMFTARGSANVLTRTTAILAFLFIVNSLALGYIASRHHSGGSSIVDQVPEDKAPAPAKAPEAPKVPEVPKAQ